MILTTQQFGMRFTYIIKAKNDRSVQQLHGRTIHSIMKACFPHFVYGVAEEATR